MDAAGDAYVTGLTFSTNFPTTTGAFQTSSGGGNDAFSNPVPGVTVVFSVGPSVPTTFPTPSGGSVVTNGSGQATFCYKVKLPGTDTIHAFADTNRNGTQDVGEPFSEATKTWTPPVSTPLCAVDITNGGWIVAMNGDRANFGGNAHADAALTPTGQEQYQDQGRHSRWTSTRSI
jgi:hypothetical protein